VSRPALLRFAPVFDARIVDDPKLARSVMVEGAGALDRVSRHEPLPVLVDHDREVGRVRDIFAAPHTDGRRWLFASVELDECPTWLKRDGGVSWSYRVLFDQDVRGTQRLLRAIIDEVTLVSPGFVPVEPLARVAWVGEPEPSPAATADRAAGGEVLYGDGKLVRRYFPNAVVAVGGVPVQRSGHMQRVGRDVVVDEADGSQVIHHGAG
jgi:hypothetical protein